MRHSWLMIFQDGCDRPQGNQNCVARLAGRGQQSVLEAYDAIFRVEGRMQPGIVISVCALRLTRWFRIPAMGPRRSLLHAFCV